MLIIPLTLKFNMHIHLLHTEYTYAYKPPITATLLSHCLGRMFWKLPSDFNAEHMCKISQLDYLLEFPLKLKMFLK